MSESKKETPLFSDYDREYHNLSTNEPYEQQPGAYVNYNGQIPYTNNYSAVQPQSDWNQSIEQIPYVQYPQVVYYQPYNYQTTQFVQPPSTPVFKSPVNKPSTSLPPAPLGHISQAPAVASSSLGIVQQPMITVPVQQTVVPSVPIQYSQPPPPLYYYPRPPPSSYYHPPPPYHSYGRYSLPPIPRREKPHERDYYDRHRHDDPRIMSEFGRRHDTDFYRKPNRWYY